MAPVLMLLAVFGGLAYVIAMAGGASPIGAVVVAFTVVAVVLLVLADA